MLTSTVWNEGEFPSLLQEISQKPDNLYVKYKTFSDDIFDNCLAIVGSRRMTDYGERVIERLVPDLVSRGISIVSGFMFGVDACAHRVCIEAGGRTIAVMPCGIDTITPAYQKDLYFSILDNGGLIVSEYDNDTKPQKWMFTKRNRIVAGLCSGVLIIEAEEDSGSLITAGFAREFDRKIYAIPGSIFSKRSEGTNKLIKHGASIVTDVEDILEFYGLRNTSKTAMLNSSVSLKHNVLTDLERTVLRHLIDNSMTQDEIIRLTNESPGKISVVLLQLSIKSHVVEKGGKWHAN